MMPRYNLHDAGLVPADDGDWVLWSDVEKKLALLDAIAESFPETADGEPIYMRRTVWPINYRSIPATVCHMRGVRDEWEVWLRDAYGKFCMSCGRLYSTQAAAEAAAEAAYKQEHGARRMKPDLAQRIEHVTRWVNVLNADLLSAEGMRAERIRQAIDDACQRLQWLRQEEEKAN